MCVCVCLYVCMCVCVCVPTHALTHTHTHTHTHTSMPRGSLLIDIPSSTAPGGPYGALPPSWARLEFPSHLQGKEKIMVKQNAWCCCTVELYTRLTGLQSHCIHIKENDCSLLALQWLPCQAPGVIGSAVGLVGPVSVYCDWVR